MTRTDYTPPPAPPPGWQPQPPVVYVKPPGNGLAVAGFVLGLIAAVTGLIPIFFVGAFLFAVLGLVFSGVGLRKAGRPEIQRAGRKLAIAGLVLSVVAGGLGIAGVAITAKAVNDLTTIDQQSACQTDAKMLALGEEESYAATGRYASVSELMANNYIVSVPSGVSVSATASTYTVTVSDSSCGTVGHVLEHS